MKIYNIFIGSNIKFLCNLVEKREIIDMNRGEKVISPHARRIEFLMHQKNIYSIYELSRFTKVSYNTINGILKMGRKPSEATLQKISEAFGYSIREFYDLPTNEKVHNKMMNLKERNKENNSNQNLIFNFFNANINNPHLQAILEQVKRMDSEAIKLLIESIKLIAQEEKFLKELAERKNSQKY